MNALERMADRQGSGIGHPKAEIAVKQGQLKDYESRMGNPFEHEAYQGKLADLRDRLKLGLSEEAIQGGTSAAELAGQIRALQASMAVESVIVLLGKWPGRRGR